jgi:hypothetical protein
MLRALKALNANAFGDDKQPADVGLETPLAKVVITLEDGAKRELSVGSNAEGTSRWVQAAGNPQIFSISSWAGDWTTAEPKKFEKKDESETDAGDESDEDSPAGMPGMPTMPSMPSPH